MVRNASPHTSEAFWRFIESRSVLSEITGQAVLFRSKWSQNNYFDVFIDEQLLFKMYTS